MTKQKTMLVWYFVEHRSPTEIRELVRQVIFLESKEFLVGNVVNADVFRVHSFRNVSPLVVRLQTKLFANDLQVVTLTDHNDVIRCFICW